MVRRIATGTLVALGLWLVAAGVQKWFDNQRAAATVNAFMRAVQNGDRNAALGLLTPQQRRIAESQTRGLRWTPDAGMDYRIHHIDVSGNHASAQLWIEKDGVVVQPTLALLRSDTGVWKIEVGRLWDDMQRARSRADGEQLAYELSKELSKVDPPLQSSTLP